MGKGRRVALAAGVLGCLTFVATCWVLRDRIVERWHLWRLEHGDAGDRVRATEALAARLSERAVLALMRTSLEDPDASVRKAADRSLSEMGRAPDLERLMEAGGGEETNRALVDTFEGSDFARILARVMARGDPGTEEVVVRYFARSYVGMLADLGVQDYPREARTYTDLMSLVKRLEEVMNRHQLEPR